MKIVSGPIHLQKSLEAFSEPGEAPKSPKLFEAVL
jgi:hypothetical protein